MICLQGTETLRIDSCRGTTTDIFKYGALLLFLSLLFFVAWPSARAGQNEQQALPPERPVFYEFSPQLPFGLKPDSIYIPEDNPLTQDKIDLGWLLFFDARLSADDSVACATCHSPEKAFTDNSQVSTGINGRQGTRNAPTVINRIAGSEQFRDGRAATLEEQAKDPLISPLEMGMPDHEAVIKKVKSIAEYRALFERAFGRPATIEDLARAIASFERTIISGNSRWDQYVAGKATALMEAEFRGLAVFRGKGRCTQCHSGWNLTDEKYHNIGVGWDLNEPDVGRFKVTNNENDIGAFRTPTLREVALTGPYMHDGRFDTLEQVVEYYSSGIIANPYLDVEMRRSNLSLEEMLDLYSQDNRPENRKDFLVQELNLTDQEKTDLVAYMKALTGEGWQDIKRPGSFPE